MRSLFHRLVSCILNGQIGEFFSIFYTLDLFKDSLRFCLLANIFVNFLISKKLLQRHGILRFGV